MGSSRNIFAIIRMLLAITLLGGFLHWSSRPTGAATQIDIPGPNDSGNFGSSVTVLPNGNIVVTDPGFNGGIGVNAGAVYLYNGSSGALISTLTGMTANDQVGSGDVTVLSNGNYVVSSPYWNNNAGAVTWGSATSGVSGVVSVANSLVGSTDNDRVGYYGGVIPLSNSNYVVSSPSWDNGTVVDAGAATWGDGISGVSGVISTLNSLVGSTPGDSVGIGGVTPLSNGNYVVDSLYWNGGWNAGLGAATWGNGASGVSGVVSAANSLVGSTPGDSVGIGGVTPLSNGNYMVSSLYWNGGLGAATWGNGTSGVSGVVSAANSLVGSTPGDRVGDHVTPLSNGNYVVSSHSWHGSTGAVTWGSGTSGVTGAVSATNSLVGSFTDEGVGYGGVIVLSNGNYVVSTSYWNAGAVTWGNGTSGVSGVVSAANSLVGSNYGDWVGSYACPTSRFHCSGGVIVLSNGNYVVFSPFWDNGTVVDAGAVTWGSGTSGISGVVSVANSLVGSFANDEVGFTSVTPLSNGNYVVSSPQWNNNAGAATWGSGTSGVSGAISAANSLVGSTANQYVGYVTALSNGNYVVSSPRWNNNAGAVTWGNGASGVSGLVSAANSLVGSMIDDQVGSGGVIVLSNSNYVVLSPYWNGGLNAGLGAATWGNGTSGVSGVVSAANSLVGSTAGDRVGEYYDGVTLLSNGNYVVLNPYWNGGWNAGLGAATWGDGTSGVSGVVSAANSLVGSAPGDRVGSGGVIPLSNGNYVVSSPDWDNGSVMDAGAVTWGNGASGVSSVVSAANSLVGSTDNDQVGSGGVTPLSDVNYIVSSFSWDNVTIADAGAVTWGFGASGTSGPINTSNSVCGTTAGGGNGLVFQYDSVNRQLVVGRPADNIVTLFRMYPYDVFLPVVARKG